MLNDISAKDAKLSAQNQHVVKLLLYSYDEFLLTGWTLDLLRHVIYLQRCIRLAAYKPHDVVRAIVDLNVRVTYHVVSQSDIVDNKNASIHLQK